MKKLFDRWWKIALAALVVVLAFLVVREFGVLDFSLCSRNMSSQIGTSTPGDFKPPAGPVEFELSPSFADYVPLYKSRTFTGKILVGGEAGASGGAMTIDYEIRLTALGLCSGHKFRNVVRYVLQKHIDKQLKDNK